jgi:hypothetical protein
MTIIKIYYCEFCVIELKELSARCFNVFQHICKDYLIGGKSVFIHQGAERIEFIYESMRTLEQHGYVLSTEYNMDTISIIPLHIQYDDYIQCYTWCSQRGLHE